MCGRARCTIRVEDVGRATGYRAPLHSVDSDRYRPSYNVAPGRYMPVVRQMQAGEATEQCSTEAVVHCMKWGLIPSFTKKNEKPDHFRMVIYYLLEQHTTGIFHSYFNARSESVHLKSSFSRLLKKSRCVTTVEGFYEWKKDGSKKQPYYLHFEDERPLVFAALYDSWKDEAGNVLHSFTILTTRVSKALGWLHDRMPVILPNEEAVRSWLNDDLSEAFLHKITQPYEASDLVWYPVTPEMGKPSFDVPECVQEVKPKVAKESSIFQLFGKRKNMESSCQDDRHSLSQVPETAKHQSSEDEIPASQVTDEDMETEEDRKALKAGMEPDQDVTEALQGKEMNNTVRSQENSKPENIRLGGNPAVKEEVCEEDFAVKEGIHGDDLAVKREHNEDGVVVKDEPRERDIVVKEEVHDNDHEDQKHVLYEPEVKKRHVAVFQRVAKKPAVKGVKGSLPDKQTSLHSFFGKK